MNDMSETALLCVDGAALRFDAERHLQALAGQQARLREDQWTAISALVADRRRVLVVQRTGWGKSAVYFIATALLRARDAGPTVIVSPLLALMRNQIEAAVRAGIRAHTINSSNTGEWERVYASVRAGAVDVLLVSATTARAGAGQPTSRPRARKPPGSGCSAPAWRSSRARCGRPA